MNKMRTLIVGGLLATLLVACAKPLPADRAPYAGVWRGGPMVLVILADGRVAYRRKEGNRSTSVNAPLKEFKGDNFVVGVGVFSTEFAVSSAPHENDGVWQMTVDGVEVTRTTEDPVALAESMSSSS
jgi:hypothetical protein